MAEIETIDPRGLFREAYRIEGIDMSQCRSIFMDWALGKESTGAGDSMKVLLDHYGGLHPDHPMTDVLREGVDGGQGTSDGKRRTGRRRKG
jgi:hypothetical protein